ncbi:MAG: fibronectin type III domain-containing protein [Spirochaetales bacterium]|nr:fibronectin type III domain-containing protein [Spirochaetales bacterium]
MKKFVISVFALMLLFSCTEPFDGYIENWPETITEPQEVSGLGLSLSGTDIVLNWIDPDYQDLDYIEIRFYPEVSGVSQPITVDENVETAIISDLLLDASYTFVVRTFNDEDDSSQGVSVGYTPEMSPPAEVSGVVLQIDGSDYELSWVDPVDADLDHIEISFSPVASGVDQPIEIAAGVCTATITGLSLSEQYVFVIRTVDTDGNISAGVEVELEGYDDPPVFDGKLYVKPYTPGLQNGLSWERAFDDLQCAIDYAAEHNIPEIWVATGTYYPGTSRSDSFSLANSLAIYGGFAGDETTRSARDYVNNPTILSGDIDKNGVLDDDNSCHVVTNSGLNSTAVLDGFTVTMGYADSYYSGDSGGGILNSNADPVIRNCVITNNHADYYGAGIYNSSSDPEINNCIISNNYGHGVYSTDSAIIIEDSIITENVCGLRFNNSGSSIVRNSVICNNSASGYGGGIYGYAGIYNCVIVNNSASSLGDGIYESGDAIDSIFWNNNGDDTYNSAITYSITQETYTNTGVIHDDPLFADLSDPDGPDDIWKTADDGVRLLGGSPAFGNSSAGGDMGVDWY